MRASRRSRRCSNRKSTICCIAGTSSAGTWVKATRGEVVHYTVQGVLGQAWQQFRDQTFTVLPHLLAGLFIFVVGLALGMVVSRAARWILTRRGMDSRASELGLTAPLQAVGISSAVRLVASAV